MSEERLKEIKHSLDFQEALLIHQIKTYDADLEGVEELLKEEKDLYNEVIRLKAQCNNLLAIVGDYNSRLNKTTKDLQELIDKVNNKTIIGLNEFIPRLEAIQDELVGDKE